MPAAVAAADSGPREDTTLPWPTAQSLEIMPNFKAYLTNQAVLCRNQGILEGGSISPWGQSI